MDIPLYIPGVENESIWVRCSSVESRVVLDGNLITSRGLGTSFEFALSLVKVLYGEEVVSEVAGPMVMYEHEAL